MDGCLGDEGGKVKLDGCLAAREGGGRGRRRRRNKRKRRKRRAD